MPGSSKLDLALLLQIGLQLRQESGIAQLEHVLMQTQVTPLRTHALNALRRAQHRLLELILANLPSFIDTHGHMETGRLTQHIHTVLAQVGLQAKAPHTQHEATSLEAAVLDAWSFSEAASAASFEGIA